LPVIDNAQEFNFSSNFNRNPKDLTKENLRHIKKNNNNNTLSTMLNPSKINDIPQKKLTVKKGQVPNSLPKKLAHQSIEIYIVAKSSIF
jgi:hypothetical protein